jgi:hypothetical protein
LRKPLSPNPMKGHLTAGAFTALCAVTTSPTTGGLLIYDPTPQPPDGSYTLTFADKTLPPVRARCTGGVCKVDDA